ncbi:MAG: hypothetical protein HOG89_00185 [Candidatus Peribacter sp.]|jgi:hypothetical protein|nr:hypothetical protein [Candidatus Peribacter sp.]MBT4600634.1 hypothetical protein [Candidatus Peribacter sp.]MBT5148697.1 hypothetical protein [Candidatus Peribacter sp.]MBT5637708.1 hypothetical protein [Candidatus Peribacter sp.]MBT5937203.1 hypothetical protein [Candidatus Peribacter sp.]
MLAHSRMKNPGSQPVQPVLTIYQPPAEVNVDTADNFPVARITGMQTAELVNVYRVIRELDGVGDVEGTVVDASSLGESASGSIPVVYVTLCDSTVEKLSKQLPAGLVCTGVTEAEKAQARYA